MSGLTLHAVVRENARSVPDRIAVVCGDAQFTHADLDRRATALAGVFAELGIGQGNRIAWLGQNSHRWLEALLAAGRLGAMLCSLNWRLSPGELAGVLSDFAPAVVLWQGAGLGELSADVRRMTGDAIWIGHDDPGPDGYEARLGRSGSSAGTPCEDAGRPVLMIAVASADGGSAGAMISHDNLLVPALLMGRLQDIGSTSVNLACAPLFHIAGLFSLIPTIQMRGTNVMLAKADPAEMCEAIAHHRCTHGFLLAPTAEAIVAYNRDHRYDLSSFRSGLAIEAWRAMVSEDRSPWGLRPGGYGQTETNMVVLAALDDSGTMTSGMSAPYAEVAITDARGNPVENGALGEIIVRGASVHAGYWRREAINAARFRNGWWRTGDLGRREPDGRITFAGPVGRLIKSGAENIYASEVERCLALHPAVSEAAVIGTPDPVWAQSVTAIVVTSPGADRDFAALQAHCRTHLASYKKPRSIVFRDEPLPRNGPGIDYAALDLAYGGGGYPGEG